MSEKSDKAKIENILRYISDIDLIIKRHNGIEETLSDYEGQYAIMMCLIQIGENVNAIKDNNIKAKLPLAGIISFRNRIVHNYEGADFRIIKKILLESLPELKEILINILI